MKLFQLKFSFLLSFLFINALLFAQETQNEKSNNLMPKEGSFGVGIIVTGLLDNIDLETFNTDFGQNILFAKYYIKDDLALRAGFGLNVNRFKREQIDSIGANLIERDSLISNFKLNFSVGIEKHLKSSKRLDPFIFAQIDLTFIGKTNTDAETRTSSQIGTSSVLREIKEDGGIAFGIQTGGGFNYFLAENFSIGTELALRFLTVSQGGTISDNTSTTAVNGTITGNFSSRENQVNTTNIDVQTIAQINISYFF